MFEVNMLIQLSADVLGERVDARSDVTPNCQPRMTFMKRRNIYRLNT